MKQNVLLSALLAAMLVIAGCGGGNSSAPPTGPVENTEPNSPNTNTPQTPQPVNSAYSALADATDALADLGDTDNIETIYQAEKDLMAEISRLEGLSSPSVVETNALALLKGSLTTVQGYINTNIRRAYEGATVATGASFEDVRDNAAAIASAIASAGSATILAIFEATGNDSPAATPANPNRIRLGSGGVDPGFEATAITHSPSRTGAPGYTNWLNMSTANTTDLSTLQNKDDPNAIHGMHEYGRNGMTAAQILPGQAVKRRIDTGTTTNGEDVGTTEVTAVPFSRSVIAGDAINVNASSDFKMVFTWKGIEGHLYCQGTGCGVTQVGGNVNLAGGSEKWFFVADGKATDTYVDLDGDGNYVPEKGIGKFGYWLTNGSNPVLSTFAYHDIANVDIDLEIRIGEGEGRAENYDGNKATYTGDALGLYVWKKGSGNREAGEFMADASLTATFADANSRITGTLSNFRNSSSKRTVGNAWSVTLSSRPIGSAGVISGGQTSTSSGGVSQGTHAGVWIGQMYTAEGDSMGDDPQPGGADKRPEGVVGQFDAIFGPNGDDGYAVGAFGAEKS